MPQGTSTRDSRAVRFRSSIQKVVSWGKSFKGSRQAFEASIRPGDMAVISHASHHYIVVSVDIASGTMETVDGNQEWGRILKRDDHKLSGGCLLQAHVAELRPCDSRLA